MGKYIYFGLPLYIYQPFKLVSAISPNHYGWSLRYAKTFVHFFCPVFDRFTWGMTCTIASALCSLSNYCATSSMISFVCSNKPISIFQKQIVIKSGFFRAHGFVSKALRNLSRYPLKAEAFFSHFVRSITKAIYMWAWWNQNINVRDCIEYYGNCFTIIKALWHSRFPEFKRVSKIDGASSGTSMIAIQKGRAI